MIARTAPETANGVQKESDEGVREKIGNGVREEAGSTEQAASDPPELAWSPWLPSYNRDVGQRRRAHLPVHITSPRSGRHFIGATLADWRLWALGDHAMTCTSELVTNAVRHAVWPKELGYRRVITLTIAQLVGAIVVEVRDLDPRPPVLKPRPDLSHLSEELSELSEGGEGLRVVAGLADEFGVRPLPAGKSVWFLLRTLHGCAALNSG